MNDDGFLLIMAILLLTAGGAVGFLAGDSVGRECMRKEAVAAGVAKFVPDRDRVGRVKFEWLTPGSE